MKTKDETKKNLVDTKVAILPIGVSVQIAGIISAITYNVEYMVSSRHLKLGYKKQRP
jgi:hypothetical protein